MLEKIQIEPRLFCKDQDLTYDRYVEPRYLLVGGTGFLGKHLCEAISRTNCVATTISRNPDVGFIKEYASSIHSLSTKGFEPGFLEEQIQASSHVIFTAGSGNPVSMSTSKESPSTGTILLRHITDLILDAHTPPHLIYISSGGQIYGKIPERPVSETAETNPITVYGREKLACEILLNHLSTSEGLKSTILRLANPVGRWQFDGKYGLVSKAVKAAHCGETLNIFGRGQNVRDYFDADEFSEFLLKIIDEGRLKSGTYNIGSGLGHTETSIIKMVESVTGHSIKTATCPKRDFDLPYSVLDFDKAKIGLGWEPKVSVFSMISKLSKLIN